MKHSRVLETGQFFLLSLVLRKCKLLRKGSSFSCIHSYELEILSASEKVKTLEMLASRLYQDFSDFSDSVPESALHFLVSLLSPERWSSYYRFEGGDVKNLFFLNVDPVNLCSK